MDKLIQGVQEFKTRVFDQNKALFEELATTQRPEVMFITCSDSRIDPNLITQTKPGDLFVLRNAGNIVPPHGSSSGGEEATIEYAVSVLGVKHIIVCGHSNCGAMKGLLAPESLKSLPMVANWLSHAQATRQIMEENYQGHEGCQLLPAAIEENVLVQLDNLRTIPAVSSKLARGRIQLHGWVYDIGTAEVYAYDVRRAEFAPLTEVVTAGAGEDGVQAAA